MANASESSGTSRNGPETCQENQRRTSTLKVTVRSTTSTQLVTDHNRSATHREGSCIILLEASLKRLLPFFDSFVKLFVITEGTGTDTGTGMGRGQGRVMGTELASLKRCVPLEPPKNLHATAEEGCGFKSPSNQRY